MKTMMLLMSETHWPRKIRNNSSAAADRHVGKVSSTDTVACAKARKPAEVARMGIDETWESKVIDLKPDEIICLRDIFSSHTWHEGEIVGTTVTTVLDPATRIEDQTLAELGLRIERTAYKEGYGFLRFWHESSKEAPVLSIKYDVALQAATQISARCSAALEVKTSLLPIINEPTHTIRAFFNVLGLSDRQTAREQTQYEHIVAEKKAHQLKLDRIAARAEIDFGYEQNVIPGTFVTQGEYTVNQYSDTCRTLRTSGLGPCVALILYDGKTKSGALFHIDSPGKENNRIRRPIGDAISAMESMGAAITEMKVYLVGGNSDSSRETILGIQETLPPGMNITASSILQMNNSENVVINLETGRLSRYYVGIDKQVENATIRLLQAERRSYSGARLKKV